MKLLATALLLLAGCGCASVPVSSHNATVRVEFSDGICSATAVGPSTLLIATHCLHGSELQRIDKRAAHVLARTDDGRDHSLIRTDIGFDTWAGFGPAPVQGQSVSYHGNPLGIPDMLRKGYVAGCDADRCLLDIEGAPGDSGAAVLDAQGRVIGVVSQMMQGLQVNFRLMVIFPLAFTQAQLAGIA